MYHLNEMISDNLIDQSNSSIERNKILIFIIRGYNSMHQSNPFEN